MVRRKLKLWKLENAIFWQFFGLWVWVSGWYKSWVVLLWALCLPFVICKPFMVWFCSLFLKNAKQCRSIYFIGTICSIVLHSSFNVIYLSIRLVNLLLSVSVSLKLLWYRGYSDYVSINMSFDNVRKHKLIYMDLNFMVKE